MCLLIVLFRKTTSFTVHLLAALCLWIKVKVQTRDRPRNIILHKCNSLALRVPPVELRPRAFCNSSAIFRTSSEQRNFWVWIGRRDPSAELLKETWPGCDLFPPAGSCRSARLHWSECSSRHVALFPGLRRSLLPSALQAERHRKVEYIPLASAMQ